VSGGLDGLIKVWDVKSQSCVQTVVERTDGGVGCGGMVHLEKGSGRLVLAGEGAQVRIWEFGGENDKEEEFLRYKGHVARDSNERAVRLAFHPSAPLFAISTTHSKNIEIYSFRSKEEAEKKRKRRLRRRREKLGKENTSKEKTKGLLDEEEVEDEDMGHELPADMMKAQDELSFLQTARSSHKVSGMVFARIRREQHLVVATANNSLELHKLAVADAPSVVHKFDMCGHPTGVRSIALSPKDNSRAVSVTKGNLKLWNVNSRSCIRSLPLVAETDNGSLPVYALVCLFLDERHALIGTREGHVLIVELFSGEVVFFQEKIHSGAVWSADYVKETGSVCTGGAGGEVLFWSLEEDGDANSPVLVHQRTLKMTDDVLCARYSKDGEKRMVAVSTLDCTLKVFFEDTLAFFLSLYGHKLPVLSVDMSTDDTLLISGSADKTIKIWGLDFGDAHRTLYGHTDSITHLEFVHKTHYFFSCSKDKTVRYWDADRFEQILLLEGHKAEVNSLVVARNGGFLLSGGMDRQIRVWERTKEMVFVQEERERAMEANFDTIDRQDPISHEEENPLESDQAVRKSILAVKAGDRLMEAIETADQETKDIAIFAQSARGAEGKTPNLLLLGYDPPNYLLWVLKTIKSTDLEQSLLVLPLGHVQRLIFYLIVLLQRGMSVELCSNVAIVLIKNHQNQIIATHTLSVPLRELRRIIKRRLTEYRNAVGYNLAALKVIAQLHNEKKHEYRMDEEVDDIWKGMGLGSDLAAALERKKRPR